MRGRKDLALLEVLRWLCALRYAFLKRGKSTDSDGSGSRSGPVEVFYHPIDKCSIKFEPD